MTFDLSSEQQALVSRALVAASANDAVALKAAVAGRAADAVLVVEEVSLVNATLGAQTAFDGLADGRAREPVALAGLVGSESAVAAVADGHRDRARLFAAAIAVGIGRAAVEHTVDWMKDTGVRPGPDETVPHWALADGATEVEAARLLTYQAAQMLDRGERAADAVSRAQRFAANAAERAVDAALRVIGAAGFSRDGLLDRLARDAKALQVILR